MTDLDVAHKERMPLFGLRSAHSDYYLEIWEAGMSESLIYIPDVAIRIPGWFNRQRTRLEA